MSHEIRTPLNAILGLAHLLSKSPLDTEQRDCLSKIELAGRALLGGLNDVLDLSKIEAAEMELESARFDLHELMTDLEQLVGPQARAKQLELRVRRSSQLPQLVFGDVTRVRQVLLNLLSNAVKFTERGHVELELSCEEPAPQPGDSVLLACTVRDTGIGIAPQALASIFSPFTQADASTTRRFGGSGLGLAIARQLSELMGGELGVRSVVGQGSEFWLRLPLQLAAADELELARPRQLLIADDDPVTRISLAAMARALGFEAELVESGRALCERALARLRAGQPLDAIVTDWRMPDLSGLDALAELARQLNGAAQLPAAFLISASSASEHAGTAQLSLVRGVLEKPVTLDALARALRDALGGPTRSGSPGRWSPDTLSMDVERLPDVQVLVVDDSAINLEVARRILEREGALVTTATDGSEAVARLAAAPARFDVVLMDLQMPVMDGHEATRRIRQQLRLTKLPVIALTAGALVSERQRALEAGMSAFATKPLDPRSLGRLLRQQVEAARGSSLPLRQHGASRAEHAAASTIPGLDTRQLPADLAREPAQLARLLEALLREAERSPLEAERLDHLHKLRGSAAALGALELAQCAGALERALRAADGDGVERARGPLERALCALREQTLPALQQLCQADQAANQLP